MSFPELSAGHFHLISTKENAIVSCLFYVPSVLGQVQFIADSDDEKRG